MIRLNKILFDLLLPFKEVRKGYHIVDGDLLPIFINELIAHSASQCCIPDNHHASGFVKGLPIAYRNVVSVVNSSKSYKKTVLLFEPLAEEYNITFIRDAIAFQKKIPDNISRSIVIAILGCAEVPYGH